MIDDKTRPLAAEFHMRHCDAEDKRDPNHVCQGAMTITAALVKFECPRCGEEVCDLREQMWQLRELKLRSLLTDEHFTIRQLARRLAYLHGMEYYQLMGQEYYG